MLRRVWILGLPVLVVSAVVGAAQGSSVSPSALVIERTMECTVPGVGFPESVRYMTVGAQPRTGSGPNVADPLINFSTEAQPDSIVVGLQMGRVGRDNQPGLQINRRSCTVKSTRPIFSSRGLRGGRITLSKAYTCDTPAKVRVRVRAVFTRSAAFRPFREHYLWAAGRIATAQIVVTTLAGKRIAYVSADSRTGRVQLFQSTARCFPA
ncbi:MAG: hypothetical protein WD067_10980 [Gaiellaceae bacterium]